MKAMVLCSGGVDSTTCLGMAVDKYGAENVIALSIYYGQKHTKEIECAKKGNDADAVFFHAKAGDARVFSQMFCVDKGVRCTI